MNNPFPIDEILPQLKQALGSSPAVVLQAPPGAGKTTRVPLALLKEPWLAGKSIIMLEPRRLAASNAARFMASTLSEEVGRTVGYSIRFDRKVSAATRIEVVTEGILTRRLQQDPFLERVGLVIFDEFHERNLNADVALALCRDSQLQVREDLKLLVMSATLDGAAVSKLLNQAPIITSQGRSYPVEISYLEPEVQGRLPEEMARAIRKALSETEGDVLAFLPGAGEIRRCETLLQESTENLLICPLYGDLPFNAQEEAIQPHPTLRKVVLATNIAETSLTIEGVKVVVDGGFARQSRFDPTTGMNRLETVRVSTASAEQRAGRAGRLAPGTCYRLWTTHTQRGLVPQSPPEILTSDLTPLALDLAQWGIHDVSKLAWLDPPPEKGMEEGRKLLLDLGALDEEGKITPKGKSMANLPIHPRLANLLLAAEKDGSLDLACDLVPLLSERDIFRISKEPSKHQSPSDLLDRLSALEAFRKQGRKGAEAWQADPAACGSAERVASFWKKHFKVKPGPVKASSVEEIGKLLLSAYPDRLAQQRFDKLTPGREKGSDRYLLSNGRGAKLAPQSSVRNEPYLVAPVVEGGTSGEGLIRMASALSLETVYQLFGFKIVKERKVTWSSKEGKVLAQEEERLGPLILKARPVAAPPEMVAKALLEGITSAGGPGLAGLNWSPEAIQFKKRVEFLSKLFPEGGWPDLSEEYLSKTLSEWLGPYLQGITTLEALSRADLLQPLKGLLSRDQLKKLEEGAPTHLTVPSSSRIALDYEPEEGPVLAVKLQELFGLGETPKVAFGKVPVLIHLLSPAGRPVQVTRDLKSFWEKGYPEVKKELKGRYPRHPWPDDPWNALPTKYTKKRAEGNSK